MGFLANLDGIELELSIRGYRRTRDPFDVWCKCDFSLRSGQWLNYWFKDDETLNAGEIDELYNALQSLLDGTMKKPEQIICIEPDFEFRLYPADRHRSEIYGAESLVHEIDDIYVDWRVYFWDSGLMNNYLSVKLYRDDIKALYEYLESITKQ